VVGDLLPLSQVAGDASAVTPGTAVLRGIFAGWLIALVVWMLAASTDAGRVPIIVVSAVYHAQVIAGHHLAAKKFR